MSTTMRERIDRSNEAFERWRSRNPGRTFKDYYIECVARQLDDGRPHATIGGNLRGDNFLTSGRPIFEFLVGKVLRPHHVCVDYGCGSLRIGHHIMRHLEPGAYWGLDVTDRFYREGVTLLGAETVAAHRPNLRVISRDTVAEARAANPDVLLAFAVLIHVSPEDFEDFWDGVMGCLGPGAVGYLRVKTADELTQFSGRSWAHPEAAIERAVAARGGRCRFDVLDERQDDELGVALRRGWLEIRR